MIIDGYTIVGKLRLTGFNKIISQHPPLYKEEKKKFLFIKWTDRIFDENTSRIHVATIAKSYLPQTKQNPWEYTSIIIYENRRYPGDLSDGYKDVTIWRDGEWI